MQRAERPSRLGAVLALGLAAVLATPAAAQSRGDTLHVEPWVDVSATVGAAAIVLPLSLGLADVAPPVRTVVLSAPPGGLDALAPLRRAPGPATASDVVVGVAVVGGLLALSVDGLVNGQLAPVLLLYAQACRKD
jgi:hypothetical protein